jgi:hypothetical protein
VSLARYSYLCSSSAAQVWDWLVNVRRNVSFLDVYDRCCSERSIFALLIQLGAERKQQQQTQKQKGRQGGGPQGGAVVTVSRQRCSSTQ